MAPRVFRSRSSASSSRSKCHYILPSVRLLRKILFLPAVRYVAATFTLWFTLNSFRDLFVKEQIQPSLPAKKFNLDFFVAGFPKCGTTALLYAFEEHSETNIPHDEYCDLMKANTSDSEAISLLRRMLIAMRSKSRDTKLGIKCPEAAKHAMGLRRLADVGATTKIIIGIRHPVIYFQSYYNYRITELHDLNQKNVEIPDPETLIEGEWRDVSVQSAKFEDSLIQLGKTKVSPEDIIYLAQENKKRKGRRIFPNKFQIFLYTSEQLGDDDLERSEIFRKDLQDFLGLKSPFKPFQKQNVNTRFFPENIHICDSKHDKLRKSIIEQATYTKTWIMQRFIKSDDVFVGGKSHFENLLSTWMTDPCLDPSVLASLQNAARISLFSEDTEE